MEENRHADKVIEKLLRTDPRWGARDRKFIAETIYDIIRWLRKYREASPGGHWHLLAAWLTDHNIALPPWDEFEGMDARSIRQQLESTASTRAIAQSIPDWLDQLGASELGERWEPELAALNTPAPVTLRTNILRNTRRELDAMLTDEGIETIPASDHPDALHLKTRLNVFRTAAFQEGRFEVQDAGSQTIAPFLQVASGMRVIDACAGAGGKTLHLAALMNNTGRIIALDTEDWKLEELRKRARRAGIHSIEKRVIESNKVIRKLYDSADRLLLDVPCSGLGVLRRNPDTKWKLSPEVISRTRELQQQILTDYAPMVRTGGLLVYATCSILPSENEQQVQTFTERNPDFILQEERRCWPSEGTDGFYMARLIRNK
ncbi:MAG: RsmB/NOP family class I SAM-dependent RNA methyltransferase [Bacteroidota bacterium]